jgi:hypothetical protein
VRRWLLPLALLAVPAAGRAQERPEARLVLSIFGGVSAGRPLWEINRQPVVVLGTEAAPRYDTLRLARSLASGIILGVSGTLFRTPHLGISGEIVFLGLGTDDQCTMVYDAADPLGRNSQVCSNISRASVSPTAVGFFAGGVYRMAPRGAVTPYLRGQLGLAVRNGSTVETSGSFVDAGGVRQRVLIEDQEGTRLLPSAGVATGLMIQLGPGYQARLELRDQVLPLDRVTGPADALGNAPTGTRLIHHVALTASIDIVLEQRRGRRY